MTVRHRCRRGYTLVEMCVVMAGLIFLMTLLGATVWGTVRMQRTGEEVYRKHLARSALADQFRADVAHADAAPKTWSTFAAGPQCLILRQASTDEAKPAELHIVYVWNDDRL